MAGLFIDLAGWAGALLILLAYVTLSIGRLRSDATAYQIMNILGAAGLILNSGWYHALPSVGLNVVWMAIGIYALFSRRKAADT